MASVMRLMAPPLPAASRPSKRATTRKPRCLTHAESFTSSTWRFRSSSSYFAFLRFFFFFRTTSSVGFAACLPLVAPALAAAPLLLLDMASPLEGSWADGHAAGRHEGSETL